MRTLGLNSSPIDNEQKITSMFEELFKKSGLKKYETFNFNESYQFLVDRERISALEGLVSFYFFKETDKHSSIYINPNSEEICTLTNSAPEIVDLVNCLTNFLNEIEKYTDIEVFWGSLGEWQFCCYVYEYCLKKYPDALLNISKMAITIPSLGYLPITIKQNAFTPELEYYFYDNSGIDIIGTSEELREAIGKDDILKKVGDYILISMFSETKYLESMFNSFAYELALIEEDWQKEKLISALETVIPYDIKEIAATSCFYSEEYFELHITVVYFKFQDRYYYYHSADNAVHFSDSHESLYNIIEEVLFKERD